MYCSFKYLSPHALFLSYLNFTSGLWAAWQVLEIIVGFSLKIFLPAIYSLLLFVRCVRIHFGYHMRGKPVLVLQKCRIT